METKKLLGELLIQQGIVNQETVNDALRVQVGGNRRLGHILLRMGTLTDDQLADTLSQQLGIPLTDIDASFSTEVKRLLPRYLCSKYGILPLSLKENNILLTAMADPSDNEAISDIEHYTGKVVEPCLAKQSDISRALTQKIPFSLLDFFNPQANIYLTRGMAAVALTLVVVLGAMTFDYIQTARHGTISHPDNSTLYKHLNLMVAFDNTGKISLLGHSAFAKGYYSVVFNNTKTLSTFINSRKNDFSAEQNEWLEWVLSKEKDFGSPNLLAQYKN